MSTYAIGDVQGCYRSLQRLLTLIHYNPQEDFLWFCGDVVNRGPQSLATLRFVKETVENGRGLMVLGNHDLHFLSVAFHQQPLKTSDTFTDILQSADKMDLAHWLRRQPLLHHDAHLGYTLVHGGLPPQWNLTFAKEAAAEVEASLQEDGFQTLLPHLYGDTPNGWDPALKGWDRLRFIVNAFTRIRCCDAEGRLNLTFKKTLREIPSELIPWFKYPYRQSTNLKICFGHWAALYSDWDKLKDLNVIPLDSGCVWGNALSAFRLEDARYFSCPAQE